jgi:hypothetical protein
MTLAFFVNEIVRIWTLEMKTDVSADRKSYHVGLFFRRNHPDPAVVKRYEVKPPVAVAHRKGLASVAEDDDIRKNLRRFQLPERANVKIPEGQGNSSKFPEGRAEEGQRRESRNGSA